MAKTKMEKNAAFFAAGSTRLTHQELAVEALSCALNGLNRVSSDWYETAEIKARKEGDVEAAGEYAESKRQQIAAAERRGR